MDLPAVTFQTTFMIFLAICESKRVPSTSANSYDSQPRGSYGSAITSNTTTDRLNVRVSTLNNGVIRFSSSNPNSSRSTTTSYNKATLIDLQIKNGAISSTSPYNLVNSSASQSRNSQTSTNSSLYSTNSSYTSKIRPNEHVASSSAISSGSQLKDWKGMFHNSSNNNGASTLKRSATLPPRNSHWPTNPPYLTTTPFYTTTAPSYTTTEPSYTTTAPSYTTTAPSYTTTVPSYTTTEPSHTIDKSVSVDKPQLCDPTSDSQENGVDDRIVFGINTSIYQHPYQLALEGGGSHICGGSILTEFWALTAAHCVYNQPPTWLSFRAGSSLREEGGTVHRVKYYIYHENFRTESLDYDVAVVRVKEAFVYDNLTSPVNLNQHPYNGGVMVVATGWGYKQRALLTKPKQLQSAEFLTLDSETCRRRYPRQITERMLCAEDPNNITDICSGDSGGALVLKGSPTLVGIVSWSHACADGLPSVYTNISSVAAWIREEVCSRS